MIVGLLAIVNMPVANKVGGINQCYQVTGMDAGLNGKVSTLQIVADPRGGGGGGPEGPLNINEFNYDATLIEGRSPVYFQPKRNKMKKE